MSVFKVRINPITPAGIFRIKNRSQKLSALP
jgi:hypothetical protein